MKYLFLTMILAGTTHLTGQSNSAFRSQLSHHINNLNINEVLHLEYQKKGCWGPYEKGIMSFTLDGSDRVIVEQKTVQDGKPLVQNSTGYDRHELIAKLENAKDIARNDDEYAINNVVTYTFIKGDIELGLVSLPLLPDEIIHPLSLKSNLSDFFKKDKKKGGLFDF